MKESALLIFQKNYKAKRKGNGRKARADRPRKLWEIDMVKFVVPELD